MTGFAIFCLGLFVLLGGVGGAEETVTNGELIQSFIVILFGLAMMYLGVRMIEGK